MLKTTLKRVLILNAMLLLIAIISFLFGVVDLHVRYLEQKSKLAILDAQIQHLSDEHNRSLQGLIGYERLNFKNIALAKHLPQFDQILEVVYRIAPKYGFNPDLVLKIIQVESGFRPLAVSSRGAYGLMQVNLDVWQIALGINRQKIFDVEYNVDLGLRILKQYFEGADGNIKIALHRYNNGYLYNNNAYVSSFPAQLLDHPLVSAQSFFQSQEP